MPHFRFLVRRGIFVKLQPAGSLLIISNGNKKYYCAKLNLLVIGAWLLASGKSDICGSFRQVQVAAFVAYANKVIRFTHDSQQKLLYGG